MRDGDPPYPVPRESRRKSSSTFGIVPLPS